jgi:hypothetical protein
MEATRHELPDTDADRRAVVRQLQEVQRDACGDDLLDLELALYELLAVGR